MSGTKDSKTTTTAGAAAKREISAHGPEQILVSLRFLQTHRCFKKGRVLKFRPGVNLIVGDQGTGKSSLIGLLRDAASDRDYRRKSAREIIGIEASVAGPMFAFDFERDNLRTQAHLDNANMVFQLSSMYASHGQATWPILERVFTSPESHLGMVVLDEPDMALSPRSARRLAQLLSEHAARGGQSICAVHNPIVIASQPQVYSLEHRKWMTSEAFLSSHETPLPGEDR